MESVSEEWRSVAGYEGIYEVSNHGRVKRLATEVVDIVGHRYTLPERLLSNKSSKGWYPKVQLHFKRGQPPKKRFIHQLVACAFIGEPGDMVVNHKDGDKANNRLENLEYVTQKQNLQHAIDTGLAPRQHLRRQAKLSAAIVNRMRDLRRSGMSYRKIGKAFDVSHTTARDACVGVSWQYV